MEYHWGTIDIPRGCNGSILSPPNTGTMNYKVFEVVAGSEPRDTGKTITSRHTKFHRELVIEVLKLYNFTDTYVGYFYDRTDGNKIIIQYNYGEVWS